MSALGRVLRGVGRVLEESLTEGGKEAAKKIGEHLAERVSRRLTDERLDAVLRRLEEIEKRLP